MLSCGIFVLQSKLTEFSAILKQQQNDNTSRLVSHQKEAWNEGNHKIIARYLYGKPGQFYAKCSYLSNCFLLFSDAAGRDKEETAEMQSTLTIEKNKSAEKDTSRREVNKKSKHQRLAGKFRNFKSKWKKGKDKQELSKKKKIMKHFKGANKKYLSKLSADRLAAYGLSQPRRKQEQ